MKSKQITLSALYTLCISPYATVLGYKYRVYDTLECTCLYSSNVKPDLIKWSN